MPDFEESKHPRAKDGEFAPKGSGGGAAAGKTKAALQHIKPVDGKDGEFAGEHKGKKAYVRQEGGGDWHVYDASSGDKNWAHIGSHPDRDAALDMADRHLSNEPGRSGPDIPAFRPSAGDAPKAAAGSKPVIVKSPPPAAFAGVTAPPGFIPTASGYTKHSGYYRVKVVAGKAVEGSEPRLEVHYAPEGSGYSVVSAIPVSESSKAFAMANDLLRTKEPVGESEFSDEHAAPTPKPTPAPAPKPTPPAPTPPKIKIKGYEPKHLIESGGDRYIGSSDRGKVTVAMSGKVKFKGMWVVHGSMPGMDADTVFEGNKSDALKAADDWLEGKKPGASAESGAAPAPTPTPPAPKPDAKPRTHKEIGEDITRAVKGKGQAPPEVYGKLQPQMYSRYPGDKPTERDGTYITKLPDGKTLTVRLLHSTSNKMAGRLRIPSRTHTSVEGRVSISEGGMTIYNETFTRKGFTGETEENRVAAEAAVTEMQRRAEAIFGIKNPGTAYE